MPEVVTGREIRVLRLRGRGEGKGRRRRRRREKAIAEETATRLRSGKRFEREELDGRGYRSDGRCVRKEQTLDEMR